MATRQLFGTRMDNGATTNRWMGVAGENAGSWLTTVPTSTETPTARWNATWENFTFQHVTAPGLGKSFTYTLVKNGTDTSTVITISDSATQGRSTNSIPVVSGDRLYWRRSTSGTPTLSNVRYAAELVHTTANVTGYYGRGALNAASTVRTPLFTPHFWSTTVVNANNNVVSVPGNLTELHYELSVAPGAGTSYEIALYKNGTVQNGAGGTTDTRVTIANTATSGTWTGSIALAVGDYVTLESIPTGSPASSAAGTTVTFAPTTDGESWAGAVVLGSLPTTGTTYTQPAGFVSSVPNASETTVDIIGSVNQFRLRGFRIRLSNTVTTGPVTFTTRRNSSTPSLTPTITLTSGQQTGNDATGEVILGPDGTWSVQFTATGTPGLARTCSFGWSMFAIDVDSPVDGVPVTTIADVLTPIRRGSLTISEVANGRNTLVCEVVSKTGTYRPAVDSEVVVYLNSARIFGGTIDRTTEMRVNSARVPITTRINVNDFNSLADRRYVHATLAAGTLLQRLTDLMPYLSPAGVTLDPAQATGPSLDERTYDYTQLTEVLNDTAMLAGASAASSAYVWEIDYDKVLRMYSPGTVSAPFNVVQGDGNAIGDIQVDQTPRTRYANRIILRAGTASVVEKVDTFTGDAVTTSFPLTYTPIERSDPYLAFRGYVTHNAVNETLGTGATWTYNGGTNSIVRTSAPANGNAISVTYDVQFPITVIAEDLADQALHGIIERLVEKPDVFDIVVAQALADAELAIGLERPNVVRYTTRRIGLKPGQIQTITAALRNVNDTYLVTDIRTRDSGDKDGTLIREVTATQGTTLKATWRETYKNWSGIGGASAPVA